MTDKTVRDVMLALDEYTTIDSECTVREALVALNKVQLGLTYDRHHHRALLVLGAGGEVVGKLTHWAILRALEWDPVGANGVRSLERAGMDERFIDTLRRRMRRCGGSLTAMCRAAGSVRVRDAMLPTGESIAEETPLRTAIERMVAERCQSLIVADQHQVTGILRLSDVFEEVADLIRGTECAETSEP